MIARIILGVLLFAGPVSAQVDIYAHVCDQDAQRAVNVTDGKPFPVLYNPLPGVPVTLWFCGPKAAGPLTYAVTIDGVPQPSPGELVIGHYQYSERQLPEAGLNGLVAYIGPGSFVVLPSVGSHQIRVVYGADRQSATSTWIGSTCACVRDPEGNPRPVGWNGKDADGSPVGSFGAAKIQCPWVCAARSRRP